MKKSIFLILAVAMLTGFGILYSCSKSDDSSSSETTKFEVRMCDAPADYLEVNIDIQDVQIHVADVETEKGWKSLKNVKKGIYNLLTLTNGLDTALADDVFPAGKISQMRLILGENNSLKLRNGDVIPLKVPSGETSGLKIKINSDLKKGIAYTLNLDFDAGKSVKVSGGGKKYHLKPTLRAFAVATSGAIKGQVEPATALPQVLAINGTDTVATTITRESDGKFLLRGLPAGTYKVVFLPKEGFQTLTKEGQAVTIGSVTNMGKITISQ